MAEDPQRAEPPQRSASAEAPDEADESGFDFSAWLNRQQWVPLLTFVVGLALFFVDATWAVRTVGGSVAFAGLFPLVTGRYRGPFGMLRGWKARLRGLVSVGLGLFLVLIA